MENHQLCCHQMSNFEAKIHQIQFRLGLRPRPRCGSLQRSLRPPSWWGGSSLPPPQELHPRFRPFGPRSSALRASYSALRASKFGSQDLNLPPQIFKASAVPASSAATITVLRFGDISRIGLHEILANYKTFCDLELSTIATLVADCKYRSVVQMLVLNWPFSLPNRRDSTAIHLLRRDEGASYNA